ncbi:hypothetical protein GCM10017714_15950 [Curtobacterium pusillum]|uniref:DUF4129 domain-containing protein n=1 Tax=Curtobacterium pusillum TaxID=69373 RepID=A0ABX2MCF4_9MICO|nr:hypothetical protein [Curtobacterium pusillum]NUU13346.1 hypothetical protein [Curtobacterium pusillum]GLK30855.1 hypothetical protein GCM10017610_11400 [Curtobacterium pusillum]
MDWWNDLTDWISSDDGWRVISGAIIPFVAIVVAGIVAALIGRGATKRVVAMQEREARNAAVAGIVSAARKAATWGSLGHDERAYADHLAEDADIRLRLLPVAGAPLAANWTQHEIADIKKNSSTFSFQAEQSLAEFRDRLLEWQARPGRARKLFKSDLERWKFDSPDPDAELITRQQEWNADQSGSSRPADGARSADGAAPGTGTDPESPRPTPTTTSLRPAVQRPAGTPASAAPAVSGTPSAPPTSAAPAAAGAGAAAAGAGFSVTRGGSTALDPDATTPISASSSTNTTTSFADGNATRAYGDGAAAPTRPPLGSPASPVRTGGSSAVTSARGSDADSADSGNANSGNADSDDADVVDDRRAAGATPSTRATAGSPVPPPVAKPTSADAHVNRAQDADARKVDAPGTTQTTSVPTRIAGAPAEPADANETSEAPYTQPISASELRRRAADDDE